MRVLQKVKLEAEKEKTLNTEKQIEGRPRGATSSAQKSVNQPQRKLGTKSSLRSCQPDSRQKSISEIFGKSAKRKLDEIIPIEINVEEAKSGGPMAHDSSARKSDSRSCNSKDL